MTQFKKGQLIAITSGEYSDYCLNTHVKALITFTSYEVALEFKESDEYLDTDPDYDSEYESLDRFLPWLIKTGYVEEVDTVQEFHIGYYGRFEV